MSKNTAFTRRVALDSITKTQPRRETFSASAAQCAALAERFDLQKLSNFEVDMTLTRERGGRVVHVEGALEADVVQSCVVTLEPVPSHVKTQFEVFFSEDDPGQPEDETILPGDRDWPEKLEDDAIDVAEIAAQFLSLELDPYPRLPGAGLDNGKGTETETQNPFAVLKDLAANREE